ncbi:MAG: hypothetical protein Q8Q95_03085 [bacterium]|nr:hypothetical protein [bacterium]
MVGTAPAEVSCLTPAIDPSSTTQRTCWAFLFIKDIINTMILIKKAYIFLGVAIVLIAIAFWHKNSLTENQPIQTTYKDIIFILEGKPVRLSSDIVYFGNEVKADFNGDGVQDIAFILTSQTDGSGTFYYLALALGKDDGYEGANTVFLGDRIAPQTTEYRNGEIIINYADRKITEPMTAQPSVGVSKYFKVENNKLVSIKPIVATPEPYLNLCTKEQRGVDFCTQVYAPVCAEVNIQCIKAPCNPIKETFSSSCEACKNQLVSSYVIGECKK